MWDIWKEKFLNILYKHAPLKRSRVRNKRSPWTTDDIMSLIPTWDSLKRKAVITDTSHDWLELANIKNTIIFFVCPSKILHKHCFQFLLGPL